MEANFDGSHATTIDSDQTTRSGWWSARSETKAGWWASARVACPRPRSACYREGTRIAEVGIRQAPLLPVKLCIDNGEQAR
jgi:hypothetical protein